MVSPAEDDGRSDVTSPVVVLAGGAGTIHRIGGGTVESPRLKPAEATLNSPGISVLRSLAPGAAAAQMRAAFPKAAGLHKAAATVGTTTNDLIRAVGFDLIADPTTRFPNRHRIIHPGGAAGFADENLARLEGVFTNTTSRLVGRLPRPWP